MHTLEGHDRDVHTLWYCSSFPFLVSNPVQLESHRPWNSECQSPSRFGKVCLRLTIFHFSTLTCVFSHFLSASSDCTVILWDVNMNAILHRLRQHRSIFLSRFPDLDRICCHRSMANHYVAKFLQSIIHF